MWLVSENRQPKVFVSPPVASSGAWIPGLSDAGCRTRLVFLSSGEGQAGSGPPQTLGTNHRFSTGSLGDIDMYGSLAESIWGHGQLIWNMYSHYSSRICSYAQRGALELIRGYKCVIRRA